MRRNAARFPADSMHWTLVVTKVPTLRKEREEKVSQQGNTWERPGGKTASEAGRQLFAGLSPFQLGGREHSL